MSEDCHKDMMQEDALERLSQQQQAEPVADHSLLPCPFCGHQPDEENMIDSTHPINHEGTLWTTGCLENEGGCNASMLAGSRQEAIDKWNTRAAPPSDEAVRLLERSKRGHYYCDDSWYSCPKAEGGCADESRGTDCDCGADEWNAEIDAYLAKVQR